DVLRLAFERIRNDADRLLPGVIVVVPADLQLIGLEKRLVESIPQNHFERMAPDELFKEKKTPESAKTAHELLRWLLRPAKAPSPSRTIPCGLSARWAS